MPAAGYDAWKTDPRDPMEDPGNAREGCSVRGCHRMADDGALCEEHHDERMSLSDDSVGRAVAGGLARQAYVSEAKDGYGGQGDVVVEDDADVSIANDGAWVQAWVWVEGKPWRKGLDSDV